MAGVLMVLLAGIGMIAGALGSQRADGSLSRPVPALVPAALGAEARRVARWSWAGLAVGLAMALIVSRWDRLGRGLLLAAPVLGLAVLAGTIGGELAVTGPASTTRKAGLRARRVAHYLPARAATAVALAAGVLVTMAVAAIAVASDDDLGRSGRALTTSCSPDTSSTRTPWPGWFYSAPLLAVVGLGLVLTIVALRMVVNRPRLAVPGLVPVGVGDVMGVGDGVGAGVAADPALALDEALRRWSARRVVAAAGVMVALPLLGTALVAAVALSGVACLPAAGRIGEAGLLAAAPSAAVLLGWSAWTLLVPAGFGPGATPGPRGGRA